MLPTKSNTADQGCLPVSSNCVIWQGPDIPCIDLCKGDTVSGVVSKMGTYLCAIRDEFSLTSVDLSCLVSFCQASNPAPAPKTLAAVLGFIISKVCCLDTRITTLGGGSGSGGTTYTEPVLALPKCLQYVNAQGQTVTQLVHNQYTLTLANKFCDLSVTVNTHTTQITNLTSRVTILENAAKYTLPSISLECLTGSTTLVKLDSALTTVSEQLCSLKGVLGTNMAITSASARQCPQLGSMPALSQAGTMSGISGWKNTITNLSDSFTNLWLTVCDMRGAMTTLKNCCGTLDCSSVIVDFDLSVNTARDVLTLNFAGKSVIPSTLTECSQVGSRVTVTDTAGKTFSSFVQVVANKNSSVTVNIAGSGLNTSLNYTVTLEPCVKNADGKTCEKVVTKTSYAPCTTISITSATIN